MPNSLKFGTSGLRGLATDLVGAESRRYTAAFVAHLRTRGPVTEMRLRARATGAGARRRGEREALVRRP